MKYLNLFLFILLVSFSCSTTRKMSDNQRKDGHYRLYTYPEKIIQQKKLPAHERKIIFAISNNLKGTLHPRKTLIPNRLKKNQSISVGGIAGVKSYLSIMKEEYPHSVVYLDSGSFMNPYADHEKTIFYTNYLYPDAVALGFQELNLVNKKGSYLKYLDKIFTKVKFPLVSSNLFNLKKNELLDLSNLVRTALFTKNDVNIGVLSIINSGLSSKLKDKNINGLYFQNELKSILTYSKALRRNGANIILLMYQGDIDCTSLIAHERDISIHKVNFNVQDHSKCDLYKNKLFELLTQLPTDTIDAVLANGADSKIANYIKGIPVIQNYNSKEHISWFEMYYNKRYSFLAKEKTKINQPIQLCHQFLESTQDCYLEEEFENEEVVPAMFLGHKVHIAPLPLFTN